MALHSGGLCFGVAPSSVPRNYATLRRQSVRASASGSPPVSTSVAQLGVKGKALPEKSGVDAKDNSLVLCFGEMLIDFVPTENGLSLVGEDEFGYMRANIVKENNVNNEGMRFDPGARTALAFVTLMFYRNPSADMLLSESELDFDLIQKGEVQEMKNLMVAGGLTGFVFGVYFYMMRAVGGIQLFLGRLLDHSNRKLLQCFSLAFGVTIPVFSFQIATYRF